MHSSIASHRHRSPLVFVIDDHDDSRAMMRDLFELNGFEVACYADGQQTVQDARRLRPDVIILDERLPGLDGWEVTRQLRSAEGAVARTPIVFVSAAPNACSSVEADRSGWDCFLTKPVDIAQLIEKVAGLAAGIW